MLEEIRQMALMKNDGDENNLHLRTLQPSALTMTHLGRIYLADWDSQKVQVYEKSYQSARKNQITDTVWKKQKKA